MTEHPMHLDAPHHGSTHVGANLTKKAGPFPVWVWGVVIGVVIVAVWWFRARSGAATTSTAATTDPYGDGVLTTGNNAGSSSGTPTADDGTGVDNTATGPEDTSGGTARRGPRGPRGRRGKQGKPGSGGSSGGGRINNHNHRKNHNRHPNHQGHIPGTMGQHHGDSPHHDHAPAHKGGGTSQVPHHDTQTQPHMANHSGQAHTLHTAEDGDTPASIAHKAYGGATPYHTEAVRQANGMGTRDTFKAGQQVKAPAMPPVKKKKG